MSDEITESAKAAQEVAKTTGQAIKSVDKAGSFLAKVMGESIDATVGMIADTLKYKRWERQLRFFDKVDREITVRGLPDSMRPVPPRLALPIFKYASLEDDESLHDIWVNLLVTALDPSCEIPRSVFIGIIRQLEPVDVKILNYLYKNYLELKGKEKKETIQRQQKKIHIQSEAHKESTEVNNDIKTITVYMVPKNATNYPCISRDILKGLNLGIDTYLVSTDNLMRQQLVASFKEVETQQLINTEDSFIPAGLPESIKTSKDWGYLKICITELGVSFLKACTTKKTHKQMNISANEAITKSWE